MRNKSVKAYLSYVGGFLTHLVTSTFFLWDNMSIYIASYFRYNGHPNTTVLDVQAIFPLLTLALAAGQFFGIPSGRKWGHKLMSCFNMLLYCLSFYLASYSDYSSFIFFAGILPAWCIGVEYLLPVDNAYFYNPDRKGLVAGVILSGFGFGSVGFAYLVEYLLNPDQEPLQENGYYSAEIASKVPQAMETLSLIYFCLGFTGSMMMFQTSKYQKMEHALERNSNAYDQKQNSGPIILIDKVFQAFKSKEIYILWVINFCCSGGALFLTENLSIYAESKGQSPSIINMACILGSLSNGASRIFWSALLDFVSDKTLLTINLVGNVALISSVDWVASNKHAFLLWFVLIQFQYGGIYTFFPTYCVQLYGKKKGLYIYNIVYTSIVVSQIFQFMISFKLIDSIGFPKIFYIYLIINSFGLIIHLANLWKGAINTRQKVSLIE